MSDFSSMKVTELREALEARGLDATGLKAVLVARLNEAVDASPEEFKETEGKKRAAPDSDTPDAAEPAAKKSRFDQEGDAAATPALVQTQAVSSGAADDGVRQLGEVKWFDTVKGFGFIQREVGGDVFVHQTNIINAPGTKGLDTGEKVEMLVVTEDSGRIRANDLTAVGGGTPKGVPDPMAGGAYGAPAGFGAGGFAGAPGVISLHPKAAGGAQPIVPHTTLALAPGTFRGECKWFNGQKGFGFITPEDGSEDLFCHQTAIKAASGAFRSLMTGEMVEFQTSDDGPAGKKRKAVAVTGPGGIDVIGGPREDAPSFGRAPQYGAPPPPPHYGGYAPYGAPPPQHYGAPPPQHYGGYPPAPAPGGNPYGQQAPPQQAGAPYNPYAAAPPQAPGGNPYAQQAPPQGGQQGYY